MTVKKQKTKKGLEFRIPLSDTENTGRGFRDYFDRLIQPGILVDFPARKLELTPVIIPEEEDTVRK